MDQPGTVRPALLGLLKSAHGQYLSGPALARQLGLSRTAVWKQIQKLTAAGYRIEAHPRKGYRLLGGPDRILPSELSEILTTEWLGRPYHHLLSTESTNSDAIRLAQQGAAHGTLVLAEQQTAGRGRLDRRWEAPAGRALTFSLVLRPALPPSSAPQITLVAALALVHCIRDHYRIPARIKWPNDILIATRKAAGILTEMQAESDRIRFLVLGIGINCNQSRDDLQGSFRYPATSIAIESGAAIDRCAFLAALLATLETHFERLEQFGFAGLLDQLQEVSEVLGAQVVVQIGEKTITGKVEGMTAEGALKILTVSGSHEIIWAGDITRLTHPSR